MPDNTEFHSCTPKLWIFSIAFALWNSYGTQNLEVAPIFLENLWTPDLSPHFYVKQDDKDVSVRGYSTSIPQNRQEVQELANELYILLEVSILSTTTLEFTITQIFTHTFTHTHTRFKGSYITSGQHSLL